MPQRDEGRPALLPAPGEIVGVVAAPGAGTSARLLGLAARAVAERRAVLLLDVPFDRMDHVARAVASGLARHAAAAGGAVVVVAHRHAAIAHLADRVVALDEGAAAFVARGSRTP